MGKIGRKQMDIAIDAYENGKIIIREAIKTYGLAKSTLSDYILGGG